MWGGIKSFLVWDASFSSSHWIWGSFDVMTLSLMSYHMSKSNILVQKINMLVKGINNSDTITTKK